MRNSGMYISGLIYIILGFLLITFVIKAKLPKKRKQNGSFQKSSNVSDLIKKAGNEAEDEVAFNLSFLKNSSQYTVWNRVRIASNPIPQEIDHIVLSPKGIFHLETKGYTGNITIHPNGDWVRIKGEADSEYLENPCGQVSRHHLALQGLLGENIPLIGIIVLAAVDADYKPKVTVIGRENSSIPVKMSAEIVEFIMTFNSQKLLSELEYNQVKDIIEKSIIKQLENKSILKSR